MSTPDGRRPYLLRLATVCAQVLVGLVLVDLLLVVFVADSSMVRDPVDLQSAPMLYARLRSMDDPESYRVVLLGDSVVLGATLGEHGDRDWRHHQLGAALERALQARRPERPVSVLNLGMNGALPADVDTLAGLALQTEPDLLVFDVSLRSFSEDFVAADAVRSREWLPRMSLSSSGRYRLAPERTDPVTAAETAFHAAMVNGWALYRLRDVLRWRLLGGEPRDATLRARDALRQVARGAPDVDLDDPLADDPEADAAIALLMKAKARISTASFDETHPQRQALIRLLARARKAGLPTIVFYATENPDLRDQLLPPERRAEMMGGLESVVRAEGGPTTRWVGPMTSLEPARFLDHTHLDAEGYRLLAQRLAAEVPQ